jgi:heat shock protein HslJ
MTTALLLLGLVAMGQTGPARPLEGTHWTAIVLAGRPVPAQDANREAHLVFQPGARVSGSDGCNRLTGGYQIKGDALTFGQMAGTLMGCIDAAADVERAFRDMLKTTARWRITGDRLELLNAKGTAVAAFKARPSTSSDLEGTSWQLVRFQGGNDTTRTPDDGGKYTIEFRAGGQLNARIDCNRGRGTWKSSGPNQLHLGPLTLTRAKCPGGSLHDQIVKHWEFIRSYVIKDGRLFLSLMADGGIYEFERLKKTTP